MADAQQTERAYQKQPTIFQNKKQLLLGKGGKEKLPCYYRKIGLGFKTPKEDYLHYVRKYNCFEKRHKNMSVHLSPCFRFQSGERHAGESLLRPRSPEAPRDPPSSHVAPADSQDNVQIGDIVTVGECHPPITKTVRFNVLKVTKPAPACTKNQFQKF